MARRNRGIARLSALAVLALAASGCTALDSALATIPIFSFMVKSPAFDPYEATRVPPPNTVPFAAPSEPPPIPVPEGPVTDQWLRSLEGRIHNPVPVTEETIAEGRAAYQTFCAVCHGPAGAGNGPVTSTGQYPPLIPPLATGNATTLPDAYIYGVAWVGRGLMPAYGARVPDEMRWRIVNYVRTLQQAAAQGTGAAPGGE